MKPHAAAQHAASLLYASIAVAVLTLLPLSCVAAAPAQADARAGDAVSLNEALVIESVGRYGRTPIHLDAIEQRMIEGTWTTPNAGDTIITPGGAERTWRSATADENGWLRDDALRGGYACWTVESAHDRVMMLSAQGPAATCANGVWRVGDIYQTGWTTIPVALHQGENELLFHVARGGLRASLREPNGPVEFNTSEATLPTLVMGEPFDTYGAVVIINATNDWMRGLKLHARCEALDVNTIRDVPAMPPCSIRKVRFDLKGGAPDGPTSHDVTFTVTSDATPHATATLPIRVVTTNDVIVRTFISDIDGSVQYYGLRLASQHENNHAEALDPPGLILSLHGASVEAAHQASCYTPKSWAHIVTPTNRRPYGFDWEDWGRLDALEVLEHALATLPVDPLRVAITGHSMGGHGTWHLAVTYPEKFVAAAPSAGWVSFWSYTGASQFNTDDPIEALFARATEPSQTLEHITNLSGLGVYVLHGDKDDNVPVEQARIMREALAAFHTDFAYHEEPGAGHWWGNQCMDYPPLMAFLERRMREAEPRDGAPPHNKPIRPGPFKDAFRNHMLFVVGTNGSAAENAAMLNKARYDAETFWYRGNGSIDIVLDTAFDAGAEPDRNVILYGNAETNSAWQALLADAPVQVRRGAIEVGGRRIEGDDLACIMIRPRPGSDSAAVGVVAGTSARGMQLTMRLPVFVSGVAYPDFMIWSTDALHAGTDAIRCTGYFGDDWSLEHGDIAWRDQ